MTDEQLKIIELKNKGYKYSEIAKELGINASTIRMFCNRFNVTPGFTPCKNCGLPVPKGNRCFCSDKCSKEWWREHKHKVYHYDYSFVCKRCHREFTRPYNNHQKYCSHACYILDRFPKEGANEQ